MNISHLFNPDTKSLLQPLLERAAAIRAFDQAIKRFLPSPLKEHCQVINLDKGRLVIQVDTSTWANQLRFQKSDLLAYLRGFPDFAGIISIKVSIKQFVTALSERPKPLPTIMGDKALESLKALAESSTDETLKEKLQQFLRHQKRS